MMGDFSTSVDFSTQIMGPPSVLTGSRADSLFSHGPTQESNADAGPRGSRWQVVASLVVMMAGSGFFALTSGRVPGSDAVLGFSSFFFSGALMFVALAQLDQFTRFRHRLCRYMTSLACASLVIALGFLGFGALMPELSDAGSPVATGRGDLDTASSASAMSGPVVAGAEVP